MGISVYILKSFYKIQYPLIIAPKILGIEETCLNISTVYYKPISNITLNEKKNQTILANKVWNKRSSLSPPTFNVLHKVYAVSERSEKETRNQSPDLQST